MNLKLKQKWLEALRSGNYLQGKGLLRSNDRYCCLGVLCDIVDPKGWDPTNSFHYEFANSAVYLPLALRLKCDIGESIETQLTARNDSGSTFEQIAQYIETHL